MFLFVCLLFPVVKAISLYSETDGIMELNSGNFHETVDRSATAFLVEFYEDSCGHCRTFAPHYTALARDLRGWREILRIGAVNCAEEHSFALCRDQEVTAVPFLYFYAPMSGGSKTARLSQRGSVTSLRAQIASLIASNEQLHSKINFTPLKHSLDERLQLPFLAVVIEREVNSTLGTELVIDLSTAGLPAARAALDAEPLRGVAEETPALILYQSGQPVYRTDLRTVLKAAVLARHSAMQRDEMAPATLPLTTVPAEYNTQEPSNFYVSEADLLLAMDTALSREVALAEGVFAEQPFHALDSFLHALIAYVPTQSHVMNADDPRTLQSIETRTGSTYPLDALEQYKSRTLQPLLHWLRMHRNANRTLTPTMFRNELARLKEGSVSMPEEYDHCKGSRDGLRGYPCSLWHLFHTLTVHAYTRHRTDPDWRPRSILNVVAAYVKFFFRCQWCKIHFAEKLRDMPFRQEDKQESFLWLWRAHNMVNDRQAGNPRTEDPAFPKRQFPPAFLCPHCRTGQDWDLGQVSQFLLRYYTHVKAYSPLTN